MALFLKWYVWFALIVLYTGFWFWMGILYKGRKFRMVVEILNSTDDSTEKIKKILKITT